MEKIKQVINSFICLVVYPFFYIRNRQRKIILVGGHEGQLFADNGKVFFQYVQKNTADFESFWVINKKSPDFSKVGEASLIRGSVKSYCYYRLSSGVFFSHSASDMAPIMHRFSFIRQPLKINLEHGVIGLKKMKMNGNSQKEEPTHYGPTADMVISCSPFERDIKEYQWHTPKEKLKITGCARYDNLIKPASYRREIIYMPTWREWLLDLSPEKFKQTDFYQMIKEIVSNEALNQLLEETDYTLKIYIHFYFHPYIDSFTDITERIQFLPINTDIQDYLIHSQILITDYSSVAWDFFYLKKPVLFYQPDVATYLEQRGAYMKFPEELFGPQMLTLSSVLPQLKTWITQLDLNCYHDTYQDKRDFYFTYQDQHNCQRIFDWFLEKQK